MIIAGVSIAIFLIALIGAIFRARRSASDKQRQMKILIFALYFWILVFIQLILVAIAYSLMHS
jgi:hypothetical protein